jgi:rare lipoprotein A
MKKFSLFIISLFTALIIFTTIPAQIKRIKDTVNVIKKVVVKQTVDSTKLDSLKPIIQLKAQIFKENVQASYYADKFHGLKTASGKIFDMNKLSAAHKKLPFGTKIRVTNLANKKSVVVEVNDRGPYVKGRELDLSKKAFAMIASTNRGYITVNIEVLK